MRVFRSPEFSFQNLSLVYQTVKTVIQSFHVNKNEWRSVPGHTHWAPDWVAGSSQKQYERSLFLRVAPCSPLNICLETFLFSIFSSVKLQCFQWISQLMKGITNKSQLMKDECFQTKVQ